MTATAAPYPIGKPGVPWGDAERKEWLAQQHRRRSYIDDVVSAIERLSTRFDVSEYGQLDYPPDQYRLYALRSRGWRDDRCIALISGGVHGYETSGVHGALQFLEARAEHFAERINLLVAPCVSPWGYERIHRWNADAVDPNRSFRKNSQAEEAAALMRLVAPLRDRILLHIDLHETTDTDESEFGPALAARDGKAHEPSTIPDGFYLVADSENPQLEFQNAIIDAVSTVTHIAPPDTNGKIIGCNVVSPGVIQIQLRRFGLCAGMTDARFTTTTEVYPDSPRATPEQCNDAQVAAACTAIAFALAREADAPILR